ncbi:Polyamine aminopropyltransferase [Saezia sanguinis]|uniref:Polyamine aminopropyltransferase n=1 Tax=Saezia sanguinis TaxID=1965230 RepID=A0A433S9R1_9BURK|nr:spermidine synthase [Saezia sanguinis]RUS65460.1 Polyamine aminopropyltransferase [Saezia sanguinis]
MKKDLPEVFFSEESGVRHLHLGTHDWIQGSMRVRKPFEIELEYVQRMMAWLLFFDPETVDQRHAMQLGLGAAAITKFCYKKLRMFTTAVELNPQVVALCHSWFNLPQPDERLQVVVADASDVVADPARLGSVDALCVDIYDDQALSPVLDSVEHYAHCYGLLSDDGVMTVNLFGRSANFLKSVMRIAQGFGIVLQPDEKQSRLWQFAPTAEGNTVVLALRSDQVPERALLQQRAEYIEYRWGLPARKWVRGLKPVTLKAKS